MLEPLEQQELDLINERLAERGHPPLSENGYRNMRYAQARLEYIKAKMREVEDVGDKT